MNAKTTNSKSRAARLFLPTCVEVGLFVVYVYHSTRPQMQIIVIHLMAALVTALVSTLLVRANFEVAYHAALSLAIYLTFGIGKPLLAEATLLAATCFVERNRPRILLSVVAGACAQLLYTFASLLSHNYLQKRLIWLFDLYFQFLMIQETQKDSGSYVSTVPPEIDHSDNF